MSLIERPVSPTVPRWRLARLVRRLDGPHQDMTNIATAEDRKRGHSSILVDRQKDPLYISLPIKCEVRDYTNPNIVSTIAFEGFRKENHGAQETTRHGEQRFSSGSNRKQIPRDAPARVGAHSFMFAGSRILIEAVRGTYSIYCSVERELPITSKMPRRFSAEKSAGSNQLCCLRGLLQTGSSIEPVYVSCHI